MGSAAGGFEPDHMPPVLDNRTTARHHERLMHRFAGGIVAQTAVGLIDETMRRKPSRMPAATGTRPLAAEAGPAWFSNRLGVFACRRPPSQHAARIILENFRGNAGCQRRRN